MTSAFAPDGRLVPVTVVQVGPCVVTQVKTSEKDGYTALQLGFDETSVEKLNKPISGHLKKTTDKGYRVLKEFRTESIEGVEPGTAVNLDMFSIGEKVTVSGTTKGRASREPSNAMDSAGAPKPTATGITGNPAPLVTVHGRPK